MMDILLTVNNRELFGVAANRAQSPDVSGRITRPAGKGVCRKTQMLGEA